MKTIRVLLLLAATTGAATTPLVAQSPGAAPGAGAQQGQAGQAPGQNTPGQNNGQNNPGQNAATDAQSLLYWHGYNQNPWFVNPVIAQQMRMNPEMMQSLRNNYQQNWTRYQTAMNGLPQNLTPEQMMQRQQQLTQQFENDFTGSLDQTIPDQAVRQRFQQLMTQYQGLNAFDNPNIMKRLDLNVEQRRQINRMQQEWRRTMMRLSRSNGNLQDLDWKDFYRRSNLSVDEILTPEQLLIWKEIRGEAIDFPPDIYVRGLGAADAQSQQQPGAPENDPPK